MVEDQRKIFKLYVHGEYISRTGDKSELKAYNGVFRVYDLENALGTLKGKLLTPFLRQKDPGTVCPISWKVDRVECENAKIDINDIPLKFMTFDQLKEYVKLHKLPVPVEKYGDLAICRHHVWIAMEDTKHPEGVQTFPQVFEKYKKKLSQEKDLAELNSDLIGEGSAGVNVHIDPETGEVVTLPGAETGKKKKKKKKKTKTEPEEDPVLG